MVRNLIRNQAPGNRLRVRIPCPPLELACFVFANRVCALRSWRRDYPKQLGYSGFRPVGIPPNVSSSR